MFPIIKLKRILCPFCNGEGLLHPYEFNPTHLKLMLCEECESVWTTDRPINTTTVFNLLEYAKINCPDKIITCEKDIKSDIKELEYEIILKNESHFGCFPSESYNFFVYENNCNTIIECNMNMNCFRNYVLANNFKPHLIDSPVRAVHYNFMKICNLSLNKDNVSNYIEIISKNLDKITHIAYYGEYQYFSLKWGVYFRHLVYDSNIEKMFWYQIHGMESPFFESAVLYHNTLYALIQEI